MESSRGKVYKVTGRKESRVVKEGFNMSQEIQKSYYAIIPANVRYDKELTPNAKLLYGEITALCNEKGYCWATNDYFAKLYKVSKVSISKWINQLVEKGYIYSDIVYKEGTKEILNRYLRIVNGPIKEKFNTPIKEKFNTPIKEKFKENNTVVNNTKNIYIVQSEELWRAYPSKTGKANAMKKIPKLIKQYGYEQMLRTIERYIQDVEYKRNNGFKTLQYKNGSTFFNSGYVDYLDENYTEHEEEVGCGVKIGTDGGIYML